MPQFLQDPGKTNAIQTKGEMRYEGQLLLRSQQKLQQSQEEDWTEKEENRGRERRGSPNTYVCTWYATKYVWNIYIYTYFVRTKYTLCTWSNTCTCTDVFNTYWWEFNPISNLFFQGLLLIFYYYYAAQHCETSNEC